MDRKKLDATDVAINDPDQAPLEQQCHQLEEDDPQAARRIQAQTRDSEPSIQLIVVYQMDGRDYLDACGTDSFDENQVPNAKRLRHILDNEVTINHPGCLRHYVPRPVPRGWRRCGMLRHHRILRVAADGKSLPGEFKLISDLSTGIEFTDT
jgi:hypothetical protein